MHVPMPHTPRLAGTRLREGTVVVTTDKRLALPSDGTDGAPWQIELLQCTM